MNLYAYDYQLLSTLARGEEICMDTIDSDEWHRIWALRDAGFISIDNRPRPNTITLTVGYLQITPTGRSALAEKQRIDDQLLHNIAENQAEQKRVRMKERADVRREYILFFLGLLLGWILGCFTPHQALAWIQSLFH